MKKHPCHKNQIIALKRIEGQVRGIQKMIEEGRYCVDILTQFRSVTRAIVSVQEKVFKKHLETCVKDALKGKSESDRQNKIDEAISLLSKYRGGI
ncbi:MAG: metal-sensitive transcriptional regulator [Candidatus Zapsychrus exili]|nr:metal-sensitive transcriptional regulator [Candidatus Zapsychrus exili]